MGLSVQDYRHDVYSENMARENPTQPCVCVKGGGYVWEGPGYACVGVQVCVREVYVGGCVCVRERVHVCGGGRWVRMFRYTCGYIDLYAWAWMGIGVSVYVCECGCMCGTGL